MDEIHYYFVIQHLPSENFTPFQGFHPGLAEAGSILLFKALCCAPNNLSEIFYTHDQLLEARRVDSFKCATPISGSHIELLPETNSEDFCIFFCLPSDLQSVIEICKHFTQAPLIVSLTDHESYDVINLESRETSLNHFLDEAILKHLHRTGRAPPENSRTHYEIQVQFPNRSSGVTLVGELTHAALGFEFSEFEALTPSQPDSYIDAMLENANSIFEVINSRHYDGRQETLLYAPSIFTKLHDMNGFFWNQLLRKVKLKWHRELIKNGIFKNRQYSGITLQSADENNPYHDSVASMIISSRQKELYITNLCAAFVATSEMLPALRLPNSVNLRSKQLREIEDLSKKENPNTSKQFQQTFKKLIEAVNKDIGEKLVHHISTKSGACKILSDFPLEWLYIKNLPLMISHEVSKIPTTPGNMLMQLCLAGPKKYIHKDTLLKILVIRSFKKNDPIRSHLQIAIEAFPFEYGLTVQIIDVDSIAETISALNCYSGAIVVFDCHGNHDGPDGVSWLAIGTEKMDTWELYGKARIPPIVMLSACLTTPISGSHASVANGFLRSGALSVIGTFLPVEALPSAAFMARILFRIDSFLPLLERLDFNAISWRAMISTFLKMSYTTDVLHYFMDEMALIDEGQYRRIHLQANEDINLLRPDWYDRILSNLEESTSLPSKYFTDQIKNHHPMMETMNYCQLGRPENLIIITENLETYVTNDSAQ